MVLERGKRGVCRCGEKGVGREGGPTVGDAYLCRGGDQVWGRSVRWWVCWLWSQSRLWRAEVEGEAPFMGPADSATFDACCRPLLEGHGLW